MNKLTKSLLLAFTVIFMLPSTISAATTPDFPSCSNPNSPVKVSHDEGTHGIAGDPSEYQGSDTVYNLDEDGNVYQCFCSVDGQGIQTNWWKVSSLSQDEIDELLHLLTDSFSGFLGFSSVLICSCQEIYIFLTNSLAVITR